MIANQTHQLKNHVQGELNMSEELKTLKNKVKDIVKNRNIREILQTRLIAYDYQNQNARTFFLSPDSFRLLLEEFLLCGVKGIAT